MKVKIPWWAEEVKDENWIVLFWFLRSLTVCYPPYIIAKKAGTFKSTKKLEATYQFLPRDINTMLATRASLHKKIATWPTVAENFTLGLISNQITRCTLKTWALTHTVELKEQRSKDMVMYLSGCLNHNLIADTPRTDYQINTALSGHFQWFGDEAEENGWHTEIQ
tara:strand:+ start:237 stop:734 length:498 start_codon:yes stop_codon:yes gene_type:complete